VQKDELLCDVIGDALGHERRGRGDIEVLHSRTAFTTADESPRTYRPSPVPLKRAVSGPLATRL
jgi:hypothetical protein